MRGQALFRSYGCFFAEFLGEYSLVRLGLLDLTTCVGLRYGLHIRNPRSFSWKALRTNATVRRRRSCRSTKLGLNQRRGFAYDAPLKPTTQIQ